MDKIYQSWRQFQRRTNKKTLSENRRLKLQEDLETLDEISRDTADKIQRWMRDASVMDYSFDELFDGKMRMAMPFDSEDALNLKKVVRILKKDGWKAGELVPWEGGMHTSNKFPTRKVKQKRQRLADEGGGFYEEEIEVADLGLAKSYEKEIPAGPRKGEVIQRTDKLGMGKAIAKLVKEKKLDKELLDWWHKKQTYYTKDNNWNEIEGLFSGDEVDYTVVISRHPIDVLRMSDIGSIRSCHSEGRSHFQCAMAEAKGHGPIAYLVPTTMYEMLMSGLYEEYDTADDPEAAYDVNLSPSKLLKAHAALQAQEYIERHFTTIKPRWQAIYNIINNIKTTEDEENLEFAIQAVFDQDPVYKELAPPVRGFVTDQAVMDAIVAKAEGKEWSLVPKKKEGDREERAREIGDISEFDDKEIFRDKQRGIKGIVAKGRVRFRKYEDEDTGLQFVGVEHRTYGAVPPGFVKSMNKWAAESQEEAFREAGYLDEDNHAPNWYSLTRYGGSYEDTNDNEVLGDLFRHYDPDFTSYDGGHNVNRNDEEEQEDLFDEYEQRVDELNDYAANQLGHVGMHAGVEPYDDNPYVHASAELMIELNLLGWDGLMEDYGSNYYQSRGADEDGNPYIIPKSWGGDYQKRRAFESVLEAKIDIYSEETEWDVTVQKGGAIGEKGPTTVLEVRLRFNMEDGNTPDDYENFIDYIKADVDDKYENIREGIRLALVEEGFMLRNYFDKLNYAATEEDEHGNEIEPGPTPAEEFAGSLQHFEFYPPSDDGDGEMLFVSRGPGKVNYITTPIMMPASLRKHDRATGWTVADLETAFGGERFSLGFGTPPSVKHTGLGMHKIAMALGDIQKEAEAYAGKQLSLDFGETYEAPPDQYVLPDFAKNVEFITVLATPTASQQAGLPETDDKDSRHLGFGIRVKILSVDSEREIKGAIAFMEYVDKEIRTIARAFQSLWEPAIEEAVETKEKAQAAAVSKGTMEQLTNALDTKVRNMLNTPRPGDPNYQPPLVAILKAYIEWAHTAWPEMDLLERRTLINQYLRPLQQGSLGTSAGNFEPNSSGSSYSPLHWHRAVKQSHREAGAPEAVWGRYGWVGPDFREILQKHQAEAGIDRDAELDADIEQAERVAQELSPLPPIADAEINAEQAAAIEAERQSWADAMTDQPEDPEDLRERLDSSLRNVVASAIYNSESSKMSRKVKLQESIRAIVLNEQGVRTIAGGIPRTTTGQSIEQEPEIKTNTEDFYDRFGPPMDPPEFEETDENFMWDLQNDPDLWKRDDYDEIMDVYTARPGDENFDYDRLFGPQEIHDEFEQYPEGVSGTGAEFQLPFRVPEDQTVAGYLDDIVTSTYGTRRRPRGLQDLFHQQDAQGGGEEGRPVENHPGIDYAVEHGSDIVSVLPGRVVRSGYNNELGNYAVVQSAYTDPQSGEEMIMTSQYAHLSEDPSLERNQWLEQGALVGTAGNTGRVSPAPTERRPHWGTHLHFQTSEVPGLHRPNRQDRPYTGLVGTSRTTFDPFQRWPEIHGVDVEQPPQETFMAQEEPPPYYPDDAPMYHPPGTITGMWNEGLQREELAKKLKIAIKIAVDDFTCELPTLEEQPIKEFIQWKNKEGSGNAGARWRADEEPASEFSSPDANSPTETETSTGVVRQLRSKSDTQDFISGMDTVRDRITQDLPSRETSVSTTDTDASGHATETGRGSVVGTAGANLRTSQNPNIDRIQDIDKAGSKAWYNPLGFGLQSGWLNPRGREARRSSELGRRDNWKTYVGAKPGPGNRDSLQESYVQHVYEVHCSVNIHKQKGGNRDQTLTDIRGIPGVTIVSIVPGTSRELPHTFITTLAIKFELNRKIPATNYLRSTLLPGLNKIPGVTNFMFKSLTPISSTDEEV